MLTKSGDVTKRHRVVPQEESHIINQRLFCGAKSCSSLYLRSCLIAVRCDWQLQHGGGQKSLAQPQHLSPQKFLPDVSGETCCSRNTQGGVFAAESDLLSEQP